MSEERVRVITISITLRGDESSVNRDRDAILRVARSCKTFDGELCDEWTDREVAEDRAQVGKVDEDERCLLCGAPEWNSAHAPKGIFAQIGSPAYHPFQRPDNTETTVRPQETRNK